MATPNPPETTLDRIIEERRGKAGALREAGSDPYRNDIGPSITLAAVRAKYQATKPEPPPAPPPGTPRPPRDKSAGDGITPIDGTPLRVAGRAVGKREFGKTMFVPIRDATGDLQLYL